MKRPLVITVVAIISLLSGCATAPAEPMVQMQSVESYADMSCQQLSSELKVVGMWEQHHAEMNTYMEDSASFMQSMDVISAVLGAVGSAVDPSMAGMYQANTKASSLSTAQVETAQGKAEALHAQMAKRRSVLRQVMAIKRCG